MNNEIITVNDIQDYNTLKRITMTHRISEGGEELELSCDFLFVALSDSPDTLKFRHPSPPFSRIFVAQRGSATILMDKKEYLIKPGNIYLLPAGHPFEAEYRNSMIKGFHIYIHDHNGFELSHDLKGVLKIKDKKLFDSISAIIETGEKFLIQSAVFQLVHIFLKDVIAKLYRQPYTSHLYRKLQNIIAKTPPAELRVNSLAEQLKISRAALSKGFQRTFGISLKQHLLNTTMYTAQNMLIKSELSINEISKELGYNEVSYFHRIFKKYTGITPLEYRNSQTKNLL